MVRISLHGRLKFMGGRFEITLLQIGLTQYHMFVRRQRIMKCDGPGKPGAGGNDEACSQQNYAIGALHDRHYRVDTVMCQFLGERPASKSLSFAMP